MKNYNFKDIGYLNVEPQHEKLGSKKKNILSVGDSKKQKEKNGIYNVCS